MNIENSRVSIISQADIRYEGKLYKLEKETKSIYLKEVKSFGTEDRRQTNPVPPAANIYPLILFRGAEIKEISVLGDSPAPNSEGSASSQNQQKQAEPRRESADYNDKLFDKEDDDDEPASKPSKQNQSAREEPINAGATQKTSGNGPVSNNSGLTAQSGSRAEEMRDSASLKSSQRSEPEEEESKAPPGSFSRGGRRTGPGGYNNNYGNQQQRNYNSRGGYQYQNNRGTGYNGAPHNGGNYRGGQFQRETVENVKPNFDYSKTNEEFEKEREEFHKEKAEAATYKKDDFFDVGLAEESSQEKGGPIFGGNTNQRTLNSETFGQRGGRPNNMYGPGNYRGNNTSYHHGHNYNNGGGYYQRNRGPYGGSGYQGYQGGSTQPSQKHPNVYSGPKHQKNLSESRGYVQYVKKDD